MSLGWALVAALAFTLMVESLVLGRLLEDESAAFRRWLANLWQAAVDRWRGRPGRVSRRCLRDLHASEHREGWR